MTKVNNEKKADIICQMLIKEMSKIMENIEYTEWAELNMEVYHGLRTISANMEYQSIEVIIQSQKGIYAIVSEEAHFDMVIRIASMDREEDAPERSVEEIVKDLKVLLCAFKEDWHHFMFCANCCVEIETPRLDFYGDTDFHQVLEIYLASKKNDKNDEDTSECDEDMEPYDEEDAFLFLQNRLSDM